jgi:purine-cytosine permease-like protein
VALNTLRRPTQWEQPLATAILGLLGTVLAILGILNHVVGFLDVVGDVIIPFTFIMLVDWIWVQRRRTPVDAFFTRPRTSRGWWSWPAVIAFAIGLVISIWGGNWLPGLFTTVLPLPVVGGVISALIYGFWAVPRPQLTPSGAES